MSKKKWCMCPCPEESQPNGAIKEDPLNGLTWRYRHDESQPNGAIKEDPLITKNWAKKNLQKDGGTKTTLSYFLQHSKKPLKSTCSQYDSNQHTPDHCTSGTLGKLAWSD